MQQNNRIIPVKSGSQSKIVENYAEDMAKVIEDNKSGLVKKIIHGEEEHEKEKRNLSPESKKNKFFMFFGIIMMMVGMGFLFFFMSKKEVPTVPVEEQFRPIIFHDTSSFIETNGLTKDRIAQKVRNGVTETEVKAGGVEGIYLTNNKAMMGLREFITRIASSFIPENNPILVDDNFLLGVMNGQ